MYRAEITRPLRGPPGRPRGAPQGLNFLVDAQLPPRLARWISSHGHDAAHVFDRGLQAADDPAIWEHARTENAVIISKDEDFVDRWLLSETPVALPCSGNAGWHGGRSAAPT